METLLEVLFRGSLGFLLLLIITRMIGNKQLGQLTVFTYISGIAIGAMAGGMVLYHDIELYESALGIILWGGLTILLELISLKSPAARKILDGSPVIVINDGQILYPALKKERLNLDDLTMLLRTNQVFSISEVQYAILEANGELSVLKKQQHDLPTRQDLNLTVAAIKYLPSQIIADGHFIQKNLTTSGLSKEQAMNLLKQSGCHDPAEVLYGEITATGSLYIQKR